MLMVKIVIIIINVIRYTVHFQPSDYTLDSRRQCFLTLCDKSPDCHFTPPTGWLPMKVKFGPARLFTKIGQVYIISPRQFSWVSLATLLCKVSWLVSGDLQYKERGLWGQFGWLYSLWCDNSPVGKKNTRSQAVWFIHFISRNLFEIVCPMNDYCM